MPANTEVSLTSAMSSKTTKGRTILSKAPTRIDLSGGTIDLWPLFLFFKNPITVNLGIDLFAETKLVESPLSPAPTEITLRSIDQNIELKLKWQSLEEDREVPPALILHYKLLKYFYLDSKEKREGLKKHNLLIETTAKSPAGAGLGGSSTLSVSLIGALATWSRGQMKDVKTDGEKFIDVVRDVETTVIRVPAGLQDYYGAMFGGLQSLKWQIATHRRNYLPETLLPELEKRIILVYSGHSRNSGINNWALFNGLIDQDQSVREKFEKINLATHELETALNAKDWNGCAQAIAKEWAARKTLATGITTPEMDRAIEAASKITPLSAKICGAGGGGCFFTFVPQPSEAIRNQLTTLFKEHGMRTLPFHAVSDGLRISCE